MNNLEQHPDKLKWNDKHQNHPLPDSPSETLTKYLYLASRGKALDLACGLGRNSRYLVEEGFEVDAVDISDYALSQLEDVAGIHTQEINLREYQIPLNQYDLICNIFFNERRLTPYIKEGLKPGGILVFESFVEDSRFTLNSFKNRDHYLRVNEILHVFIGMRIHYYEEKDVIRHDGSEARMASLVAEKI